LFIFTSYGNTNKIINSTKERSAHNTRNVKLSKALDSQYSYDPINEK
jgi:hypothetical protein